MIKKHSDDPDTRAAAHASAEIVAKILKELPKAEEYDYAGHEMHLGDYGVCERCTSPIAEAQQAGIALAAAADNETDPLVQEHVALAVELLSLEARAAEIRAELHNGQGSEAILNTVLGFLYERGIQDAYDHSHHAGQKDGEN
jgi:hypothetical protein